MGQDAARGTSWITRHVREAKRIGKPVMLGEFGIHDNPPTSPTPQLRNVVFQEWTSAFIAAGGTDGTSTSAQASST